MNAPLFVISGPSGVGKTTVVEAVLADGSLPLRRAITATTRAPRVGEKDGRDYFFWTEQRFHDELAAGKMLEHAIVHERDYYGTPQSEVTDREGKGVLLVIDVQGAASVRAALVDDSFSIFLMPPSLESLRDRLTNRASEDETTLKRRLISAERELNQKNLFHVRIVNDQLSHAVQAIQLLIREQFTLRGIPCSTN